MIDLICKWFDVKELIQIVPIIYNPKFGKDKFAALAGYLARETGNQDLYFERFASVLDVNSPGRLRQPSVFQALNCVRSLCI